MKLGSSIFGILIICGILFVLWTAGGIFLDVIGGLFSEFGILGGILFLIGAVFLLSAKK